MRSAARRGNRVTPARTWAAVIAAFVLHGVLLGSVHAFDISIIGEGFVPGAVKAKPAKPAPDLVAGCEGDAFLTASARVSMCYAPWVADVDDCVDVAYTTMWLDLSGCQARNEKGVAEVAMLDKRQAEKVKSIDPEPLLEALQQPKPEEKPPEIKPPQPQPPQPPAPPPPPRPSLPMQVVETAKPQNETKPPEDTRLLSEYDTHVEKQKVARGSVQEPMVAKSQPSELTPKQQPKEPSVAKQEPDRQPGKNTKAPDVPGTLSMRSPGATAPAEVQQDQKTRGQINGASGPLAFDGYIPRRGDGALEQPHKDRSEIPKGENGAGGGQPNVPNLKASQEVLERAIGGGNVDHLEDVDDGDETALNSKRWIYASFFNRLKRQVAQNWDPGSVWRRIDPTGQVNGFKTRVTEVRVSLSPNGALAKIVVINPSGVADLDDEAVRAFHAAAPFPNPPKDLVAKDDLITFAFTFYFEIGGAHTSWRVIRNM
jgi:TonB family protein